MKILQINTVYGVGSTGVIVADLHEACVQNGMDCLCAHRGDKRTETADTVAVSSAWDSRFHRQIARVTAFKGAGSARKTAAFLKSLENDLPDIVHLHNLHGSYVNLPLLFSFLKRHRVGVVWTLHDCWPVTALCPHFSAVGCENRHCDCTPCPQRHRYTCAPSHVTRRVLQWKRKLFTGMENAVIVTPSHWLESTVRESFLGMYPIRTIYNGVDAQIFKPTASDFRQRYGLETRKIVLGVAAVWSERKGVDIFEALARRLSSEYAVVLVGADETVKCKMPPNVLCIVHTHDRHALAEIYSAADVFVNPTREEVLGMVNLEALACGTPVVTADAGGSPECIDERCGAVVRVGDTDAFERQIVRICQTHPYHREDCLARAARFEKRAKCDEYLALYRELYAAGGKMK